LYCRFFFLLVLYLLFSCIAVSSFLTDLVWICSRRYTVLYEQLRKKSVQRKITNTHTTSVSIWI
jgi:hypothetical protein